MQRYARPLGILLAAAAVFVASGRLWAAQSGAPVGRALRVDPVAGDDKNDAIAKPVKSIARALQLATAGDTVHLATARYRETAVFVNKRGEPDRPITLDGHGATLDGAQALRTADWRHLGGGLHRNDRLLPMNPAMISRWYFLFDGRMNRMGRVSKGPHARLKKPEDLLPGEWTYLPDASIEPPSASGKPQGAAARSGAFFIRIDPVKNLAGCRIEAPIQANGVAFAGRCAHLVIRNLTATHVHNDGFNIHGDQRDLTFENIRAVECGDDGFSAHETAECRIDGFTSIGNSTGLCDVGASRTHYRNVFIRDCLGYDVYFVSHGQHSLASALVESAAVRSVVVTGDSSPERTCAVRFHNVLVRRVGPIPGELLVGRGGRLAAERSTFDRLSVQAMPGSAVHLDHCRVAGDPKPEVVLSPGAAWSGKENFYDVERLRVDQARFSPGEFAEFQKRVASETGSLGNGFQPPPPDTGADERSLTRR